MQEMPRRIVDPVLAQLDEAVGAGYSAVLYGSAARAEFVEGVSDVNLLLVCDRLDSERLRHLGRALAALRHQGQPPPLLIERDEWTRAADVFPVEIVDMQVAHECLRGSDPLAGMEVAPADLRRALEQELRGKLLRLRQAYALHAGEPRVLEEVVVHSVTSIAALLRALLVLAGTRPPRETPAMLTLAGERLGTDLQAVATLWEKRRRQEPDCPPVLFEKYLAAIGAAIRFVDHFTEGGM
jgi:predicted nucleotidyltransferase